MKQEFKTGEILTLIEPFEGYDGFEFYTVAKKGEKVKFISIEADDEIQVESLTVDESWIIPMSCVKTA